MAKYSFIIPLHLFPFDVMVLVDCTDTYVKAILRPYDISEDDMMPLLHLPDTCRARTVMFPSNQTVIRLKRLGSIADMAATVAHETVHACMFILNRVGQPIT